MSAPSPAPDPPLSTNVSNSLAHLYRGEVGRMTAYRTRLDTTTNWAVITTAGLLGYAFSDRGSHAILLGAMLLDYFFLHVEARRFRSFEIAHLRVRLLERFFFPSALGEPKGSEWRAYMIRELEKPHLPLDRVQALGWRLRHNYLWIYAATLIAWLVKLDLGRSIAMDKTVWQYLDRARIENVPGAVVFAAVLVVYSFLVALAVRAHTYPLELD